MLERLARFCYRRRWFVLAFWVLLLVGVNVVASSLGSAFHTDFNSPDSESKKAEQLLQREFPSQGGAAGSIVWEAKAGINDPAVRADVSDLLTQIKAVDPQSITVVSPYTPAGERQISADGTIAYATVNFSQGRNDVGPLTDQIRDLRAAAQSKAGDVVTVELGGGIFQDPFQPPASEALGLLAAMIILLIAFGSLLAMGLPILTALFGIGSGIAIVTILSHVMGMPDFTTQLAAMIGLGVGIDYALFIVTRYRENLEAGMEPEQAVVVSINTAGRAVLFAGTTVVISLLGMFLMGLSFVRGLATGASLTVFMTMLASVTLLPAVLGFVGRNIDKFGLPHKKNRRHRETIWYRWSRAIQHRPWPAALSGLTILLLLAAPVLSMRLAFNDEGSLPTSDTARRGYDLLSKGFGPGFNGPFFIAVEGQNGAKVDMAAAQKLSSALGSSAGVAAVTPPVASPNGNAALIRLYPTSAPQDAETAQLLHQLRNEVVPAATAGTSDTAFIGGFTASGEDFAAFIGSRLPIFIGGVLLLSFLLLMIVFRSVLVPLKAVIMNLLSIGAAYGVIVAVFQFGWGASLIGVAKAGPIEPWVPMMLFAIVFGLSMDYEVFLLSRVQEEYHRTGDNGLAVADGLAATARVITAAAAIMVFVFGSFVLGDQPQIKVFGLGLAVAVLIDATIVRLLLVPATMELLGDKNWWIPRWLDRILPRLNVEGTSVPLGDPDRPDERELVGAGR